MDNPDSQRDMNSTAHGHKNQPTFFSSRYHMVGDTLDRSNKWSVGEEPFHLEQINLLVQLTQTTKGVYMGQLSLIQFSYHVVALLDYLKSDYILVMFREQILCWTQNSYGLFITFYE